MAYANKKVILVLGNQQIPALQLATGELVVSCVPAPGAISDINHVQVLGAALSTANPVITGLFDAAGNRMPAMDVAARPGFVDVIDRAARLLGIVYGDLGQVVQITPADTLAAGISLRTASFPLLWDAVAGDWNRQREGAAIGQALTDPADRAARLLGIIYGTLGQLAQLVPADALTPGNALQSTSFPHVYDVGGGDWNRWIQSAIQGVPLVQESVPTSPIEGQITLGGAAQQCPADPCLAVTFENPITNSVVSIGHDNAVTLLNGYRLQPGATKSYAIDNVNRFWIIGTAAQVISYGGVDT